MSGGRSKWNGVVRMDEGSVKLPSSWKTGRMIFVNSMADLFHDEVPLPFIQRVFATMKETRQHSYQILTKRAERLAELAEKLEWPENVWMGVSVENADYLRRIDHLRETDAKIKFLSVEPLLGPLGEMDLSGIDWVIVGGESGPGARPMDLTWVRSDTGSMYRCGCRLPLQTMGGGKQEKKRSHT